VYTCTSILFDTIYLVLVLFNARHNADDLTSVNIVCCSDTAEQVTRLPLPADCTLDALGHISHALLRSAATVRWWRIDGHVCVVFTLIGEQNRVDLKRAEKVIAINRPFAFMCCYAYWMYRMSDRLGWFGSRLCVSYSSDSTVDYFLDQIFLWVWLLLPFRICDVW